MTWLALRLFAGRIIGFLGKLNVWQIACIALAIFAGVQTMRVSAEKRHSAKLSVQVSKLAGEIERISSKRDEQKVITRDRIVTVEKQIRHADDVAKRIESAPLPGNCKTPSEVLQADL